MLKILKIIPWQNLILKINGSPRRYLSRRYPAFVVLRDHFGLVVTKYSAVSHNVRMYKFIKTEKAIFFLHYSGLPV